MAKANSEPMNDVREQPIYWFAILESAVERGEYHRAADAQHELHRLGVDVRFRRGESAPCQ